MWGHTATFQLSSFKTINKRMPTAHQNLREFFVNFGKTSKNSNLRQVGVSPFPLGERAHTHLAFLSFSSYLMAEAMALGICKSLGYQSKWQFEVYLREDTY